MQTLSGSCSPFVFLCVFKKPEGTRSLSCSLGRLKCQTRATGPIRVLTSTSPLLSPLALGPFLTNSRSIRLHFICVTIPAVTPTFSSSSRPTTSPEVPRNTSSSHVPLRSHMIHPRAPSSHPMPRDPVSRSRWVRLRESPPSTPNAPDEPKSSTDPRIDSTVLTEDLSILRGLLSRLPMSLWSAVPDITDGH